MDLAEEYEEEWSERAIKSERIGYLKPSEESISRMRK